jgi:peptidoglycan/LPS O-acetylase OafA/YrhL
MGENRHNNFEVIRIFAALQVLQEHVAFWLNLPRPAWFIYMVNLFPGVPIFFIVSGFLVTRSYLFGAGGTASYFARRALRIYPALWVNMVLIVLMLVVTGSLLPHLGTQKLIAWLAVAYASGADIYANFAVGSIVDPNGFYPFFPSLVLWTIPVELGFYLLVPIIALRALRRLPNWTYALSLLMWTLLSLVVMFVYGRLKIDYPNYFVTKILSVTTPTYLWYFLNGAFLGVYWRKSASLFADRFPLWLALHLSVAGADALLFGHLAIDFHDITPLLPLHVATLAAVVISFAFSWRNLVRFLGGLDLSYGTYLYHVPVLLTLKYSGLSIGLWCWPTVTGVTLLVAAASWFAVERPALRLKSVTDRWLAPGETAQVTT